MGVTVQFSYTGFVALFPEFAYLTPAQATAYFNIATQFCRNDGGGPVPDANTQTNMLNFLTAHVAKLFAMTAAGQNAPDLVGRISDASEGSVHAAVEYDAPPRDSWYIQTRYGAAFVEMKRPFTLGRFMPPGWGMAGVMSGPATSAWVAGGPPWYYPLGLTP